MKKHKTKTVHLDFRKVLIMFALIPLIVGVMTVGLLLNLTSSKEVKEITHNSLLSTVNEVGIASDNFFNSSEETLKAFSASPIVKQLLQNPNDSEIQKQAQKYVSSFFSQLNGWEGLYIADWNSTVLAHSATSAVGMTLRQGDALKLVQNGMLSSKTGSFNVGIITSPSSGNLVYSIYVPILDGNNPIGYVGAGTYVKDAFSIYTDVTNLNLNSAYIYFVDKDGIMIHHPDEAKIGNPVENSVVKGLVEKMQKGEHPDSECVIYFYKGVNKYAAYYVGINENYIAVLTTDEKEALADINKFTIITIILTVSLIVIFAFIALLLAKSVTTPLTKISDIMKHFATGNTNVDIEIKTHVKETINLKDSAMALKNALKAAIGSVKKSSVNLAEAINNVDSETSHNVDSVNSINSAIEEVATTSQAVAENAQTMADKANILGDNIDSLTKNIQKLKTETDSIRVANEDASKYMHTVMESSNESVEAVANISRKINETNTSIEQINECIAVIEDIASQTNLLSLNASIEAARAGESGRGFAVVAEEIRKLADTSANSVKEIRQIISTVTSLSNETVNVAEKVTQIIDEEQKYIKDTQEKFELLSSSVDTSIEEISSIRDMTVELNAIKDDLSEVTADLSAMSEELGASAEEVSASCQQVTVACNETQTKTEEMKGINGDLEEAIEFFKI